MAGGWGPICTEPTALTVSVTMDGAGLALGNAPWAKCTTERTLGRTSPV